MQKQVHWAMLDTHLFDLNVQIRSKSSLGANETDRRYIDEIVKARRPLELWEVSDLRS